MKLPEYVTKAEVKKVCRELKLKDWSVRKDSKVTKEEAAIILKAANTGGMKVPVEEFRMGLEVELEHGLHFPDANVTNNHPLLTARIVLAHLKETLDYYVRLNIAEIEGDLLKAYQAGDAAKLASKYALLLKAKAALAAHEAEVIARQE